MAFLHVFLRFRCEQVLEMKMRQPFKWRGQWSTEIEINYNSRSNWRVEIFFVSETKERQIMLFLFIKTVISCGFNNTDNFF